MRVSDGGTPPLSDVTVVTVDVQRNLNKPKFDKDQYTEKILETQSLGVPFTQVRAFDSDQKVNNNIICFKNYI